jgi:SAM-dependent MidA family methyltransferase
MVEIMSASAILITIFLFFIAAIVEIGVAILFDYGFARTKDYLLDW